MKFHVRELLKLTDDQLVQVIPENGLHYVVFDDQSEVEAVQNETRYSRQFWEIFQGYNNTQILPKHHAVNVLKGEQLSSNTHLKLCSAILKSIVESENLFYPEQKEPLLKKIYQTISDVMGWLAMVTEEDVISLDILDFVQVTNYSKIKALRQEAMQDQEKIKYAYENILKVIETDPYFDNNGLAKTVRAKMVRMNQVNQCVGFRGIPSEVDGTIFSKPIWTNYTSGNRKFYDLVADSRTAAKSHFYSDSALKDSEYRARKFQLYSMVLERVVYEDCGSTDLTAWKIRGPEYDSSGTTIYPGDLPMLTGKYYKVNKEDEYKIIQGNEKELIGTTIWMRTILGCKHPDPHATCHICAGYLSQNISRFANIGHLGSVTTSKEFTQNILSIKHVNMSSVVLRIMIGEHEQKYLNTGNRGEGYFLNKPAKGVRLEMTVLRDEAPGLLDISQNGFDKDALSQLSLPRISNISIIRLVIIKDIAGRTVREEVQLPVRQKQNNPMMSRELLAYLSAKGWTVDENNNFIFSMDSWDYNQPILVMQNKEESFVDLADEVKAMIQSSQKLYKKRIETNAPKVLLQELFDTVNSKLKINILSFEILIYGLMVESNNSYALARNAKNPVLGIGDALTIHRSLGPAFAFQNHEEALFEPMYFYAGKRPDSPMDVFLCPQDVVVSKYGPQT